MLSVSIHAPVWGATIRLAQKSIQWAFQSTHPCGVRQSISKAFRQLKTFQSTHPCGVRPLCVLGKVWLSVSIHAPVWGATGYSFIVSGCGWGFQSTHPCGVRHWAVCGRYRGEVSIHAPVWGATLQTHPKTFPCRVSIHAPVWGATIYRYLLRTLFGFQSTHPCGVRLSHNLLNSRILIRFQSTHPCGVRPGQRCSRR